ncbi:MAG TPA: hypothetical protein VEA44_06655 [Caulobacter sp.]|nr:hypothetical protein [Caulobacter sp.]
MSPRLLLPLLLLPLAACGQPKTSGGPADEEAHRESPRALPGSEVGQTSNAQTLPDQASTATPAERQAIDQGTTPQQNPPPER